MTPLILASGSEVRSLLLRQARVPIEVVPAAIDEASVKRSLLAEDVSARDIADALAEAKARKVASKYPGRLVLGADQVLEFEGELLSKLSSPDEAIQQLTSMRGKKHDLFSAAVIYDDVKPVWRHVGKVSLFMRDATDAWLADYVDRNWSSIQSAVGGYKLEEEGSRLFTKVHGDYFNVLGMPLLEILSYLTLRGFLPR